MLTWLSGANWLALVGMLVGGLIWSIQKGSEIDNLKANQFGKDAGGLIRSDLETVKDRLHEVMARLDRFDAGGTQALQIIRERLTSLTTDVAGQNIRCQDINRVVSEQQRKLIELEVRFDALHPDQQRRRSP